ncbi:MAG: flagellar biosynthetic protein FliO [Clostridia bacterium]|nr:flagellar biosynthetic protein FliO [Clostridia bacterium]
MKKYNVFLLAVILIIIFNLIGVGAIYGASDSESLNLQETVDENQLDQPTKMGGLLARYVISVIGILVLTFLGVKFFVRQLNPVTDFGDWIQIIDYMPLGANKGFYLVEIEGKGYVLGITEQEISILTTIENQERLDELRGLSLKKKYSRQFKRSFWPKSNKNFQQTLQKHINQTQDLFLKHKQGDKTYEK